MNSSLSQTVREKIESDFDSAVQTEVAEMLSRYEGNEQNRVQLNILRLADGSREEVALLVDEANMDYRNIIFWAEYSEEERKIKS